MQGPSRDELLLGRTVRMHEESAARHEEAALLWDQRGHLEWAQFARRCAAIEREVAQLAAARIELKRLRDGRAGRPDAETAAEIRRRSLDVRRRTERLKRDDARLERERVRLRDVLRESRPDRADTHDGPAGAADDREWLADEREWLADVREREADERERIADERETSADEREASADEREQPAGENERTAAPPERERRRRKRLEERRERDRAGALREHAAQQRDIDARDRQTWHSERLRRLTRLNAADPAVARARETAQQLSVLLTSTAQTLEKTAVLAEEHARRHSRSGRREAARWELATANRAREAAQRARRHAREWLDFSATR